jgi:CheY-like chemotaxis protein
MLLVDDQMPVARGLARLLEHEADAVVVASWAEALEVLQRGERFDLVLSDIMMPGMRGSELFERVRALDPAIARRFAFASGGTTDPEEEERIAATGVRRLSKPVSVAGVRVLLGLP